MCRVSRMRIYTGILSHAQTIGPSESWMAAINWGNSIEYDRGVTPSVTLNDEGVVVEVHEVNNGSSILSYRVGTSIIGNTVVWGESHQYNTGTKPRVTLNNSGLVIAVHKSKGHPEALWYQIGQVCQESKTISWGKGVCYDSGDSPAVTINDHGTVIVVHTSTVRFSNGLFYRTGKIDAEKNEISFSDSVMYDNGASPTVALNNAGLVIALHNVGARNGLRYNAGVINGNTIEFSASRNSGQGSIPSVALDDRGRITAVHRSHTYKQTLWSCHGTFDGATLSIGLARAYANGLISSVATNSSAQFVEVHQSTGATTLHYHCTRKFPKGNHRTWMKDNYESLKFKCLYEVTLPGTHDSGAYDLNHIPCPGDGLPRIINWIQTNVPTAFTTNVIHEWSKTQALSIGEQLNHGIRFFDLRIAGYRNDFYIHHGNLGPCLSDIFHELHTFMSSVERELVIISVSHMKGMDDFSHTQFMELIIRKLGPFLYQNMSSDLTSLRTTQIQDILENGPKIVCIYGDPYLRSHPNQNFWPSELIYDHWSDTNEIDVLMTDQQRRLHDHPGSASQLFELQWIFSPQIKDIVAALKDKLNPIKSYVPTLLPMTQTPNHWLKHFIESNHGYHINIIIVDFCEESDVVEQCIRLNTQ